MKKNILFLIISLALSFNLKAQNKSEIAVITYIPYPKVLSISMNGTDFKTIQVPKDEKRADMNVNPALQEINKMIEDGWELFDTNMILTEPTHHYVYSFILIRKKQ